MSRKRLIGFAGLLVICFTMAFPVAALASGNDVGRNVAKLLTGYATELYGGIVGVVSLMFLLNRQVHRAGRFPVRRDRGGVDGVRAV